MALQAQGCGPFVRGLIIDVPLPGDNAPLALFLVQNLSFGGGLVLICTHGRVVPMQIVR